MIDSLQTFIAVATASNFSEVARSQGVAVSSVSRRLDWLENELGTKLLNRSSRKLTLTDAGQRFLPRARTLVADINDAKADLLALDGVPRGVLTVTAPSMFGRQHIAPAIVQFLQQYPLLEVDLHLADEFVDLTSRRVDVAIRMGSLANSDLVATKLAPIRRLVCASPEYLDRRGTPIFPVDLMEHNCLTVASLPRPADWWCFAGVNRDAALPVHGTFRSDDTGALLHAALAGVGVVHLASWLVGEMVVAGRLIALFPDAQPPRKMRPAIFAVRMQGRLHTAKTRLFIGHLRKTFGSPPYWDRLQKVS